MVRGRIKQPIPILTAILLLVSVPLMGCGTQPSYTAEALSLDYQKEYMRANQLVLTLDKDIVKEYEQLGLKEAAGRVTSGRHVFIAPLRTSSVPYTEIEQVVNVFKTNNLAKQAFDEWNEPIWGLRSIGADWVLSLAIEPRRHPYESVEIEKIGEEAKAWRTNQGEFIVIFRKGTVLEAVAVKFDAITFQKEYIVAISVNGREEYLPVRDARLIRWSMDVVRQASSKLRD